MIRSVLQIIMQQELSQRVGSWMSPDCMALGYYNCSTSDSSICCSSILSQEDLGRPSTQPTGQPLLNPLGLVNLVGLKMPRFWLRILPWTQTRSRSMAPEWGLVRFAVRARRWWRSKASLSQKTDHCRHSQHRRTWWWRWSRWTKQQSRCLGYFDFIGFEAATEWDCHGVS